ncbi:helix-turn-helix domain-containing protein [Streptacidiphilus albus]|uniref:helix-turn-helix domain-containing protein n=1 Tax=Streptacidiphilus albus TaxID=105425 RepID=UPI00054B8A62|nr:helix-turn-helix transcriptional regulator [Streptacidiphilus albus]
MQQQATVRQRRTMPAEIGVMLAAARIRCGWRRKEAARILGIAPTFLFNLEAGLRCPSVTSARQLAAGLALSEAERTALLAAAVDDAGADSPWRKPG